MATNTSLSEKRRNLLELDLKHFVRGLIKIKSKLIELQVDNESLIHSLCSLSLMAYLILKHKKKSFIVVLAPKSKWTIWKDKLNTCNKHSLITNWLQIVARELTSNVKVYKPFWNKQCQDMSKKLWLPIKTDCVDSDLTLSNSYVIKPIQKLQFLTMNNIVLQNKNLQKTSCLLSPSLPVSKWVNESIELKTKKIKLYPTVQQRRVIIEWFHTYRYVYNKCIYSIKNENIKNKYKLKNKHVTAKNNTTLKNWELKTPKAIRQQAAYDAAKALSNCFLQLKTGFVTHFDLNYKKRKKIKTSIGIEKTPSLRYEDGFIQMFPDFLKSSLKVGKRQQKELKNFSINHDCRLSFDGYKLWLCVPIETQVEKSVKTSIIALDPGTRVFQTCYDPDGKIIEMQRNDNLLEKLKKRISFMQSLRAKKKIKKHTRKYQCKLNNVIEDFHWQNVNVLTKNYKHVLIPTFESQKLKEKSTNKTLNRDLDIYRHYQFKRKLYFKAILRDVKIYDVDESYTTITCTNCGKINIAGRDTYKCGRCNLITGRDHNASRNILIKNVC